MTFDRAAKNCATLLWPRSHFTPLSREFDLAEVSPAEMPRGSAPVYLGSVTHYRGANRSDRPRTSLLLSYSLGWLKPYESALAYPPAVAKEFPPALRDLVGYRTHRSNLGRYEGQDPSVPFDGNSYALSALGAIPEAIAHELQAFYETPGPNPARSQGRRNPCANST